VGWWDKALLIRNTTLLWAYSVGFELMEATFAVSWVTGHGQCRVPEMLAVGLPACLSQLWLSSL
jgi:hypothetical protein